jgi:hypothetical protein
MHLPGFVRDYANHARQLVAVQIRLHGGGHFSACRHRTFGGRDETKRQHRDQQRQEGHLAKWMFHFECVGSQAKKLTLPNQARDRAYTARLKQCETYPASRRVHQLQPTHKYSQTLIDRGERLK